MVRLFTAAALTLLAVFTYRNARRQTGGTGIGSGTPAHHPLQTWEDEGGGVPAKNSGSQTLAQVRPTSEASLGSETSY